MATTLFEKISAKTAGEKKSLAWYRSAVKAEASSYKKNFNKYILKEKSDNIGAVEDQDANELRRYTVQGHMYMFEYKAKMKHLPYFDKFPLVYVLKSSRNEFWGVNLHYLTPKRRAWVVKRLFEGRIDAPRKCFHKYLTSYVDGYFLDLAAVEWATAILLPIENFVHTTKTQRGLQSYPKEVVWDEINEDFYDKIKQKRIIRGYGKAQDKTMVER